jgi:hypothetical protein
MTSKALLRNIAVCLCALTLATAVSASDEPRRVLFIGNSYTGVNQLPNVFGEIIKSVGLTIPAIKSSTPGALTLLKQLSYPASLALIDEGEWDVVVLQGQSLEPAIAESDEAIRADFLKGAQGLCERARAKSPQARIYFYETWARHADFWKSKEAMTAVGKDPAEMQARLRKWYDKAAELCKASVVRAGDAWALNYQDPKALRLHAKDNSHPEFRGTYLAALVFFHTIYHHKDLDVRYRGKLSEEEASYLKGLAEKLAQNP